MPTTVKTIRVIRPGGLPILVGSSLRVSDENAQRMIKLGLVEVEIESEVVANAIDHKPRGRKRARTHEKRG